MKISLVEVELDDLSGCVGTAADGSGARFGWSGRSANASERHERACADDADRLDPIATGNVGHAFWGLGLGRATR